MEIEWTGKSGRVYQCALEPINTLFEEIGGVYLLCKPNKDIGWQGIEAFETDSFRRSITDQVSYLIRRYPDATHVALIPFDNAAEAHDALRDLTG